MRLIIYRLITRFEAWWNGPKPGQVNYKNHEWRG